MYTVKFSLLGGRKKKKLKTGFSLLDWEMLSSPGVEHGDSMCQRSPYNMGIDWAVLVRVLCQHFILKKWVCTCLFLVINALNCCQCI